MDAPTKAFFAGEVRGKNAECFDCGQKDPQWASLTNGIYICLTCSGRHRAIGCHLSFVRCIWMDKFKPEQLVMMQAGGNQRLADYLDEHGPQNWQKLPIEKRYDTPQCTQYRNVLKARAEAGEAAPLRQQKTPAPAAVSPGKASAFNLFDVIEGAENLVNEVFSPQQLEVQKPLLQKVQNSCTSEAQKMLDAMHQKAPETPKKAVVKLGVAPEPQKVVVAAAPSSSVDVWGDDFWD